MSINHFSSELPEAHWWSHSSSSPSLCRFHIYPPTMNAAVFDLNNEDDNDEDIPKDRLFEKPLTPSDVGKLNRLVIPKQHAEKHFPLNSGGDNGLLLGFEDEGGKAWRFRYSYWNSSQSYVLTKGWSRFVKEKQLDAGDIVMFARHRLDTGRLFIGWRRRNSAQPPWGRVLYSNSSGQQQQQQQQSNSLTNYRPAESLGHDTASAAAAGGGGGGGGVQKQTTSSGSGHSKMVRLFGVNLECHEDSEATQQQHQHPYYYYYSSSNDHPMQDISFSGGGEEDVYRQG